MFDFLQDIVEGCKTVNFYLVFLFLPLLFLAAPCCSSRDFPVFRLQGFESGNIRNGSFAAAISAEAAVQTHLAHRKCCLVRMEDLTLAKLKEIVRMYPLGLIIVLPEKMEALNEDQRGSWLTVERMLVEQEFPIPIYFTHSSEPVNEVIADLKAMTSNSNKASSATSALVDAVFGNGYQVVVSAGMPSPIATTKFSNIIGSLINTRRNVELDSLLFVSHFDAFSPSAELSYEVDTSGTGPASILSLAKTLSRLYANSETQPNLNVNFLLSGGGKVNFLGSNYYLQHNEQTAKNARLVLAIDSLNGVGEDTNTIYFHRKFAKSSTASQLQDLLKFQEILENTAKKEGFQFEVLFRKPNVEQWFQWEHERYSVYRAATISGHSNPFHPMRSSLLDEGTKSLHLKGVVRKMEVIEKAVLQYLFNVSEFIPSDNQQTNPYQQYTGLVQPDQVDTFLSYVSSHAHSSQHLSKGEPYVQTLFRLLSRYAKMTSVQEFRLDYSPTSLRKEDVVFYDQSSATAYAYRVKPAVFDLFLSLAIAAYVALMYLSVVSVPMLHSYMQSKLLCYPTSPSKVKSK